MPSCYEPLTFAELLSLLGRPVAGRPLFFATGLVLFRWPVSGTVRSESTRTGPVVGDTRLSVGEAHPRDASSRYVFDVR